jgi:hypothetical protein
MITFSCWVCGVSGMGDIDNHECNLNHFNGRFVTWLDTVEGRFLTYMAKRIIDASNTANLPLAES